MKRRQFLEAGCIAGIGMLPAISRADEAWAMPLRMTRPDVASDEGGLWALMDREEAKLRRSPFSIRDQELHAYILEIICRLSGDHCPDIRVYLVRNRYFNASMAPNGMMQVWSGLMLRVDNEAQLAAVLGHEIGHYLQRHSIDSFRDAKSRSAFGVFLGMFGVVGLVGQLANVAGGFANSRTNEQQADRIGLTLMSKAGYDPAEASKVWENLLLEAKANPSGDPTKSSPMFATHPPMEDRKATLEQLAASLPRGVTNEKIWQEKTASHRREWLNEEVKRGQFEESIALLSRLMQRTPVQSDFVCARADVYRMRASDSDLDAALTDYRSAIALGNEPPETHRGMGMIYRQREQLAETRKSFTRYLELAPQAPDSAMIKNYLEELGT